MNVFRRIIVSPNDNLSIDVPKGYVMVVNENQITFECDPAAMPIVSFGASNLNPRAMIATTTWSHDDRNVVNEMRDLLEDYVMRHLAETAVENCEARNR